MSAQKIILYATVLLSFILILVGFYFIITPDMYRQTDPSKPIGYVFVPDKDEKVGKSHLIRANFWTHSKEKISSVRLQYRRKSEEIFKTSQMDRVKDSSIFVDTLPTLQDMADRYFYYIEAEDTGGNRVLIPSNAPERPLLYVTYEGRPNKIVLLFHIVLTMGSTLFLVHALYYAILVLAEKKGAGAWLQKCFHSVLWAWISFFTGAIPLGILVTWQTFGEGWGGWPIGSDVTDSKSQVLVLYWALVLLLRKDILLGGRGLVSQRAFSFLVLLGMVVTTVVFLIPHSLFFQS